MLFSVSANFPFVLVVILFCCLPNVTIFAGDADQIGNIQRGASGYPVILFDTKTQQISGLQTMETRHADYQPEFIVFGKAVNVQPLLILRSQYQQAITESKSARAKFNQSEQSFKRTQDLFRLGIVAKRRLQELQSQWLADKSLVDAADFKIKAIADEARLNWGKELTDWALSAGPGKLDVFLSGQQSLLRIILPPNRHLVDDVRTIHVDASGNRMNAQGASLISVDPQTDNTVQGVSYFFQTHGKAIRSGMNVSAWIPETKNSTPGVIIPKSALIWSMSQVFVYIKTGEERFSRRMVELATPTTDGYFISKAIKPGEHVVTTGGQMLLSEELRGQIPDGND